MELEIRAHGHPNVSSSHRTTWQLTKEDHLTPRGHCIIGIGADMSALDLPVWLKDHLKAGKWVKLRILVGDEIFVGKGQGHSDLTFTDPVDMVFRRSEYTCGRTITINTSFTAMDLPQQLVDQLTDTDCQITVQIQTMTEESEE